MRGIIIAAAAMAAAGCTSLQVHTMDIADGLTAVRIHGNMYGPGQSCLGFIRNGQMHQLACVGGPDAGVALGTAGLQGAAAAGSSAVLGASFPANKGTVINSGNATAAQDFFNTNVGTVNGGGVGP